MDEKTKAAVLKLGPLELPPKVGEFVRARIPEKLGPPLAVGAYLVHTEKTLRENGETLAAVLATFPIEQRGIELEQRDAAQAAAEAERQRLLEAEQAKPEPLKFDDWCASDDGKKQIEAALETHDWICWEARRKFPKKRDVKAYCESLKIRPPQWKSKKYQGTLPQTYAAAYRGCRAQVFKERSNILKKVHALFTQARQKVATR